MKTVLLTGFGAYAEETDNPSGAIARRLDGWRGDGAAIHGLLLPVRSVAVGPMLADAIQLIQPDVLLVTGVTPGRAAVAVERVAVNVMDFPIDDVDGVAPIDEPVTPGGPDAYFSTLPIKAILSAWRSRSIPAYVSNSAGTYLCNQTFYLARHFAEGHPMTAGLVHIPLASSSAAGQVPPPPSLDFGTLEEAVRLAAVVSATHIGVDFRLGAGSTS